MEIDILMEYWLEEEGEIFLGIFEEYEKFKVVFDFVSVVDIFCFCGWSWWVFCF